MDGDWKRVSCHGNIIFIDIGVFPVENYKTDKFEWSVLQTDSSIYIPDIKLS